MHNTDVFICNSFLQGFKHKYSNFAQFCFIEYSIRFSLLIVHHLGLIEKVREFLFVIICTTCTRAHYLKKGNPCDGLEKRLSSHRKAQDSRKRHSWQNQFFQHHRAWDRIHSLLSDIGTFINRWKYWKRRWTENM